MKVMLVDDRPLMRNGIASLLRAQGHEVVAEANDGREALELVDRSSPDLILMDIQMPGMGGLEATRLINLDQLPDEPRSQEPDGPHFHHGDQKEDYQRLSQWAINTDSWVPLIGASGAISGVLGAYLMF